MIRRLVVAALALASAVFVAIEIRDGWNDISGAQLPAAGWLVVAVLLLAAGQVLIGEAMGALPAPPTTRSQRRQAFHLTQPAKYVPAGIAQAAGVVILLERRGASRSAAVVVWVIHTASLVVAGVAIGLAASPWLGWPTVVVVPAVLLPLVLSRRVLEPVFDRAGRLVGSDGAAVPEASSLNVCATLVSLGVFLHGLGFAALASDASLGVGVTEAVAAYTLAFGVSVATPLPGGLGAREAIILGLLATSEAVLLVPVVLVRLLLIAIELVLLIVARAATSASDSVARGARDEGEASAPPADPH